MDLWDIRAAFYSGVRALPIVRHIFEREIKKLKALMTREHLHPSQILDVGTGVGSSLDVFPHSIPVIGVDRSHRMLRRIRGREGLTCVVADGCVLPFRAGFISFVSAVGLTEYLPDKEKFIIEVKRILCPGGHFIVTVSPHGVLNALRNLCGSRVYPVGAEKCEAMMEGIGFACIGREKTLLQIQYIFRKL